MSVYDLKREDYAFLIERARAEDLGGGDVTSEMTIPADQAGACELVFHESGVLCGMGVVVDVLRAYDESLRLEAFKKDGDSVKAGESVGRIEGALRSILAAERVVLNFLQRLSGIATMTARYVQAAAGTKAVICDTRKTTPGWRVLEKYAVRCGGGVNHRIGLYDAVLIKDNHLAGMGEGDLRARLNEVMSRLKAKRESLSFVEVEVDTLEQLAGVLGVAGVDMVLLDNMSCEQLREAVRMRDQSAEKVLLEASGGVRLDTVGAIAATGVDRISVGALTHGAASVDIGLDFVG